MVWQLQNKIARSRRALPIVALFGVLIWLLAGTMEHRWWLQLACFATACYLMASLNNTHSLIRIYSRMVSCTFIVLNCMACFLFPSLRGAFMQMCMAAFMLIFFTTYQDRTSAGRTYYAFLLLGMATLAFAPLLWLTPLLWVLMITNLLSISWRTWAASLMGIVTPYWFWICGLYYTDNIPLLYQHIDELVCWYPIGDTSMLTPRHWMVAGLTIIATLIGITHCLRRKSADNIRTRLFYSIFMWGSLLAIVLLILQPQHYDMLLRLLTICASPIIGHYIALTNTRVTNVTFLVLTVLALLVTINNLIVWTL